MSIEIVMTGICEDCRLAQLKLDDLPYGICENDHYWRVSCKHEKACQRALDIGTGTSRLGWKEPTEEELND